jgi:UTP--glucose-1-phosphate uridylyltransferase
VPRSRFLPVKTCNDLLAVRSDLYLLTADHCLAPNLRRDPGLGSTVKIDLDPRYFGKIDEFESRFAHGVPSLIGCRSLTVRGDVAFQAGVTIEGDVCLFNGGNRPAVIPKGSFLSGDIAL